ncbi:ankyrin-2 isoform X6 [Hydra vulgaris]|uniref:Ankyrin-2 isoform X6 n=1 Tax=Hydra vulgaris TaxID=6087 RepID=A0ABM4BTF1_HYDVU
MKSGLLEHLHIHEVERSSTESSMDFYKNQMDEDLLKAAKCGDLLKVTGCIQDGANIHVTSPAGLNILHFAARENHPNIAEFAISHGINVEAVTKRLNTALHIASLGGHLDIVKILIKGGVKINPQAKDDITPLYMAAQENHCDIVSALLKNGADPHIPAKGGFEPVDIAVQQGHTSILITLLEFEAKNGFRAIHVATRKDDIRMIKLLIDHKCNINEKANNGYAPLHIAAKHGCVAATKCLIDNGADLNAQAKYNICPIHVASKHGEVGVLAALIEGGAKLSVVTKDGLSPLHCAAREGHSHCVELLLVHGVTITAKTRNGLTALHMASQGNHVQSAQHILAHGAHIDDSTIDGVTPLHTTAHYGHVATCKLLIEKGADIDKRAHNGYTALHIAAKRNQESIVQLLLKYKVMVEEKNNNGQTALHVAAFFGHANIVLLLLQEGAAIEAVTTREETVLHIACRASQIQIARLLLRNGANVNVKSKDEETPLHNACRQGNALLVNLLLDFHADPNATNKEGATCLHLSSRDGAEKVVESLLDHNADVNVVSKKGFSPLHEAAKKGNLNILRMLLERKPIIDVKQFKNGLTPLHLACHYDKPDAALKLLDSGADLHAVAKNGYTPLHISAKKNQINIVSILLDRGVEAEQTTKSGISPLHLAAQHGNVEILDLLLDNGASPGVQTYNGLTPLHLAVRFNQLEVVKRLLKYGANNSSSTQSGYTPLHLAALYGHLSVAESLLADGAEVEAKTKNGNTPLHIATYYCHEDIIQLLLKYNAPPNALNKDGYSSLYIAEVTQQKTIVNILIKVTKITISKKNDKEINTEDKVRSAFTAPEDLDEMQLVDSLDEAEEESEIQQHILQEDFDESFMGFDESEISEHNISLQHTTKSLPKNVQIKNYKYVDESESPIFVINQEQIESINNDFCFDDINTSSPRVTAKFQKSVLESVVNEDAVPLLNKQCSNVECKMESLKKGEFLECFIVNARGCVMKSSETGVKIVVPEGACDSPTRISCKIKSVMSSAPHLSYNEAMVSHILQLSPPSVQFLEPVVIEIPHYATECNERELVVMRSTSQYSYWKEHVSSINDNLNEEENMEGRLKAVVQEFPERVVVISRPKKERFLMFPEGGTIQSSFFPEAKVVFPPNTLNTTTKVVLQVQECDNFLLPLNDETFVSPILSLDPLTILSKPIIINIPCPWLLYEELVSKNKVRLLGWMPRSPRKSTNDRADCTWKDITNETPLTIVGEIVSFSTTEFTRYWVIQTNSIDTLLKRVSGLQDMVCTSPFMAFFVVYAINLSAENYEIHVVLSTAETLNKQAVEISQGFSEVGKSNFYSIRSGQTIHINVVGNVILPTHSLKIVFNPFLPNCCKFKISTSGANCEARFRMKFLGSLRKGFSKSIPTLCMLDIDLNSLSKISICTNDESVVDNYIIQSVGKQTTNSWSRLADQLNMNKRDKHVVADLSCGKRDVSSIRLLEYWRSKYAQKATYKLLCDALESIGEHELSAQVLSYSQNKEISMKHNFASGSLSKDTFTVLEFDNMSQNPSRENCEESILVETKTRKPQSNKSQTLLNSDAGKKSNYKKVLSEDFPTQKSVANDHYCETYELPLDETISKLKPSSLISPSNSGNRCSTDSSNNESKIDSQLIDDASNSHIKSDQSICFNGFDKNSNKDDLSICDQECLSLKNEVAADSSSGLMKSFTLNDPETRVPNNDNLNEVDNTGKTITPYSHTSNEQASFENEDIIKRMFSQQQSVMEFFNEPINEKEALY